MNIVDMEKDKDSKNEGFVWDSGKLPTYPSPSQTFCLTEE